MEAKFQLMATKIFSQLSQYIGDLRQIQGIYRKIQMRPDLNWPYLKTLEKIFQKSNEIIIP